MLRAETLAGTELGMAARAIMVSGGLVGDDLVNQMLAARIGRTDCAVGFLLDGYPRTVQQAEFLDGLLAERNYGTPVILHLDVPFAALAARMTSRRQCPRCKRIYNLLHHPPREAGVCDDEGEALITRKDDQPDVVAERFKTYDDVTRPVLGHYHDRNYHQISGDRSPKYIFEEISEILEQNGAPGRNGASNRI